MRSRIITVVALLTTAACAPDEPTGYAAHETGAPAYSLTADQSRDVAALRAATARFQRFDVGHDAGWSVQFPEGCMESDAGGMGYHYLNPDAGTLIVTEPNFLMYEPQKNGRMRLVGVEYMVAGDQPRPSLFGQEFDWNADFGVWVLHVWTFAHNPDGIFKGWNPTISCRYAEPTSATHH